jgi:hypothetical protein
LQVERTLLKKEKDVPDEEAFSQDQDMDTSQHSAVNGAEDVNIVTEDSEDPASSKELADKVEDNDVAKDEQKDSPKGQKEEHKNHAKEPKEKDVTCAKCVSDWKCPEGEGNVSGSSHRSELSARKAGGSGGSSSSKHPTPEDVKKARRMRAHQSPWCRTRRRRRHHSNPNYLHPHHLEEEEEEEMSEEEEEAAHRLALRSSHHHHHGDEWQERRRREHSPVSAANPANVNVSGRTRRSLDQAPTSPTPPPPTLPPPPQQPTPQQVSFFFLISWKGGRKFLIDVSLVKRYCSMPC